MKSFNQYITEAKQKFVKGWTLKNKIHTSTTDYDDYHIKHVVNRPSKFGLTDKKILKIISDAHPDAPTEWPKEYLKELQKGVADNDVYIEDYLKKKGYCAFVLDPTHGSIQGWDEKSSKIGAKVLDDNYLPFEMDGFKLFEVKPVKGRPKYITNKLDWNDWIAGKAKRKYVSPMAQFRESVEYYLDTSKDNTEKYVANDGEYWYTGKIGIRGGDRYLKFVGTHGKDGYFEKAKLKKTTPEKIKKDVDFTIDFKKLYKK